MVIVSIVNRLDLKQWSIRSYSSWRGGSRQCVDTHCNCCYVIDLPYTSVNLIYDLSTLLYIIVSDEKGIVKILMEQIKLEVKINLKLVLLLMTTLIYVGCK